MADDIEKAGKVLGQLEQLVGKESLKFDKGRRQVKRAFLLVAAKDLVWASLNTRVEDMTNEDIDDVADELGMTLEEFAKAKPQTLVRLMVGDAIGEALEKIADDELEDVLFLDKDDVAKEIKKVKI